MEAYLELYNYKVIRKLGQGGAGIALLAQDEQGNKVVVKTIRNKQFYEREKRILDYLNSQPTKHPNIIYPTRFIDNVQTIMMDYASGVSIETLSSIFKQCNKQLIYKVAYQLLDILEYIHTIGLVHRDISSQNVILTEDPDDKTMPLKVMVIDFGAGCLFQDKSRDSPAFCPYLVGNPGISSMFSWPYGLDDPKTQEQKIKQLICEDLWQAGHVMWELVYGMDFMALINDRARYSGNGLMIMFSHSREIPKNGGHPTPPDKTKLTEQAQDYIEANTSFRDQLLSPKTSPELQDQAKIVQLYDQYVLGDLSDNLDKFDPLMESPVHDLIRLMLPLSIDQCFDIAKIKDFITYEWTQANKLFGKSMQKGKLNTCNLPCSDPVNNYYKDRCLSCKHCEWNEDTTTMNKRSIRCRPKKNQESQICQNGIWNPYKGMCEKNISELSDNTVRKRYAILYSDYDTVTGSEIKKRVKNNDLVLLDSRDNVLKRIEQQPYHYITSSIDSTFTELHNIGNIKSLSRHTDKTEMADLLQRRERNKLNLTN